MDESDCEWANPETHIQTVTTSEVPAVIAMAPSQALRPGVNLVDGVVVILKEEDDKPETG